MNYSVFLFIICFTLFSCNTKKQVINAIPETTLSTLMTGSFDSESQSKSDTSYYNISLHMYPVWTATNENWLYVEQALASNQEKPYRQRMYKLEKISEDKYVSTIYKLKNEEMFIGKWKEPDFFDSYDSNILTIREGCAVYLNKINNTTFEGSTKNDNCKSTMRGASYATSEVKITENQITSWDRGFNADGEHMWGATEGAYIFDRIKKINR